MDRRDRPLPPFSRITYRAVSDNGDDQLTGSTKDILPSSVRSMLSAGQPEKHEHQDHRNDGEHTNPERPRNVEVCQHRGIGRGFADLPEHVPCLADIGPVPSPPYRTMSGNNLLEAQTLRQLRTGKLPVYMHVENVLKPANDSGLPSIPTSSGVSTAPIGPEYTGP